MKCYDAEGASYGGINYTVSPRDTSNFIVYPIFRRTLKNKKQRINEIFLPKGKNMLVVNGLLEDYKITFKHSKKEHTFSLDKSHSDSIEVEFNSTGLDSVFIYVEKPYRKYLAYIYVE